MVVDPNKGIFDRVELETAPELADLYWTDRKYINFGFRAAPEMTMGRCFGSVGEMHCETTNIWTHLLGMIYFMVLLGFMLVPPSNQKDSRNPFKHYRT